MANKQESCKRGHVMEEHRKFHPNGDSYCGACKAIRYNAFRKSNPEKVALYSRRSRVRITYGLEPKEYDELLFKQNNGCAICAEKPKTKSLHVDHCHTTGTVRGLLCHGCNTAIGLLKEDKDIMQKAIKYLETK
jgi:hypothetical protein